MSALFFDFDNDGWLDLFVTRYVDWSFGREVYCGERRPGHGNTVTPCTFPPISNILYRSNRDGTFTDVSRGTGISPFKGRALGVAVGDYDSDGWLDVYVANDAVPAFSSGTSGAARSPKPASPPALRSTVTAAPSPAWVWISVITIMTAERICSSRRSNETYPLYHNEGGALSFATTEAGVANASMLMRAGASGGSISTMTGGRICSSRKVTSSIR